MKVNDANNKKFWEKEIKQRVQLYPNEKIVIFLARNYNNYEMNGSKSALDIGFGGGRHLKLLLDYGFNTYGIDYVEECKKIAENVLGREPNLKELAVGEFKENLFKNKKFDVITMWGVIFLRSQKEMFEDLKALYNMLKEDGKVIINFRTKDDSLYKKGKQIAPNTFILDETTPAYKGATYTFLNQDEVKSLVEEAGFKIDYIEREEYWKNNLSERHSWWVMALSK